MSRKSIRSVLPVATPEYDHKHMAELIRALERLTDEVRNPTVNFQGIPSDDSANVLEAGDFYESNGFIKVKKANDIFSGGFSASTSVGTVSVTTS